MPKYDAENLLSDVKAILVANLNAAIASVEAEKITQGLPATNLKSIDTTLGYFEQSWTIENLNIKNAIFYGIEENQATGIGPATIEAYKVFIEIIHCDSGMDKLGIKRVLRYTRAIKDVMEANYDRFQTTSNKIKIETVRPTSFKLEVDSSEEIRVGGVSIIMAIA